MDITLTREQWQQHIDEVRKSAISLRVARSEAKKLHTMNADALCDAVGAWMVKLMKIEGWLG